ncbi:MAG: hypothetical protein DRN11_01690 [Thermoplasmata archaeon]|nr:MAG: hypothetical protein DRN11_01690 [Thermoplasmata archaeon]
MLIIFYLIIKNEKKDTPPDYASVFSAGVRGFAKNEKKVVIGFFAWDGILLYNNILFHLFFIG